MKLTASWICAKDEKLRRDKSFHCVNNENRDSSSFSKRPKNVGRSDIPAAGGTDINPPRPPKKVACRYRSNQICDKGR